jgi:hypothetical protein
MIGSQIRELKRIEKEFGKGNVVLPPINKEEPSGFKVSRGLLDDDSYDPILEKYVDDGTVAESKRPPPKNNVMTVGTAGDATGQRPTGVSPDQSARYSGKSSPPLDRVIENQNTSGVNERVLREMYRLVAEQPVDGVLDLDALFPKWRGRYQTRETPGVPDYPSRAPSVDFVVSLMEGILTPNDPNFKSDMRELVQRSIDAAPATAPRSPNWKPGDRRDARWYDEHVFIAGEGWSQKLDRGPIEGDPDYPAPLYDSRSTPKQLDRDRITEAPVSEVDFQTIEQPRGIEGPETELLDEDQLMALLDNDENPAPTKGDGNYDDMSTDELMGMFDSTEEVVDEPQDFDSTDALLEDFNKQFPEFGDQAAIYKKTPLSPLRNLVA